MDKYDILKLENQICFPLYACSKEIVRSYRPFLDKIDLTYTQYIAMMALWEHRTLSVKEIGEKLFLDSGTLTPVLKTLEEKGLVERSRSKDDERIVVVSITEKGLDLRDDALSVPEGIVSCINLSNDEAATLYALLYKLLGKISKNT